MAYLKEYSQLTAQEKRQNYFKEKYKNTHPHWDDSMVLLTKIFSEKMSANPTLLDLGCGNGNWLVDELKEKIAKTIGIDTSAQATVNNRSASQIVYGNIEELLPFTDQSFDGVVSLWVMEHLGQPKRVFQEVYRVLKPGGLFAFVTPNKNSLIVRLRTLIPNKLSGRLVKFFFGREEKDIFPVLYKLNTIKEVTKLAEENNLTIIYLKTNFDPSYTSFGPVTYRLTLLAHKILGKQMEPHLVCIFRKM